MNKSQVKKIVSYWEETAGRDRRIMSSLFKSKEYYGCLFFGHIILEKIMKALVVQQTKQQAPYMHDLVRLEEIAKIELSKEEVKLLKEVNAFNLNTRYPDYKLKFYKLCTKEFTKDYLNKITILYKKLCQKLTQKK
ncbi:HEPN domain-containing protein [Candidatus Parcubacteria bacterium]|nr:HEPN domain-containing protein [Candidatus Parcubacteria bacterium]